MPLARLVAAICLLAVPAAAEAQADSTAPAPVLLRPARVFDGVAARPHDGWVVLVRGDRIAAVGPAAQVRVPAGATTIELPGMTLLPGLIDAHSHVLLHPYDETSWDDQVLREPLALRVARATGAPPKHPAGRLHDAPGPRHRGRRVCRRRTRESGGRGNHPGASTDRDDARDRRDRQLRAVRFRP